MTMLTPHTYHTYPSNELGMDGPYVSRATYLISGLSMAMDNARLANQGGQARQTPPMGRGRNLFATPSTNAGFTSCCLPPRVNFPKPTRTTTEQMKGQYASETSPSRA